MTVAVPADSTVSRLWAGHQWITFQSPVAAAAARNLHLLHSIQTSSVAFLTPYSISTKGLTLSVSQHQLLHSQCFHIHPKSAAMTVVNIITNVHLTISKLSAPFSDMLHSYCAITMYPWTGSAFWWWWNTLQTSLWDCVVYITATACALNSIWLTESCTTCCM
jgi:hypothetical protein